MTNTIGPLRHHRLIELLDTIRVELKLDPRTVLQQRSSAPALAFTLPPYPFGEDQHG